MTAILIHSSAYSGSTWLGYVLGSARGATFVGELYRAWDAADHVPCTLCAARGISVCPVLGGIEKLAIPAAFGLLSERTAGAAIVDNSKKDWFTRAAASDQELDLRLVHVIRDPRGWLASVRRRNVTDLDWALHRWHADNEAAENALRQSGRPSRVVVYDTLTREPYGQLVDLFAFCGLPFRMEALDYWRTEHHAFAANGASAALVHHGGLESVPAHYATSDDRFYAERWSRSFVDDRWRSELSRADCERVADHRATQEWLGRLGFRLTEDGVEPVPAQ